MARRVVLLITADYEESWQAVVRHAGYLPLPAPTVDRALFLVTKIRPAVILCDAQLVDAQALALVHDLRAVPAIEQVPVVMVGSLPSEQFDAAMREPHLLIRQVDGPAGILAIIEEVVGGPRPSRPSPYR